MNTWRDCTGLNRNSLFAHWPALLTGAVACGLLVAVACIAFNYGASQRGPANISEAILHATASHGATNVAVATGQVGEDAEGIFILDFLTGNLQCWVFYPRYQRFGAKFETNINAQLPPTKNAEYLLVTGGSTTTQATGNARPAGCLVYVTDVKSGMFAAYTLPWNRSMESTGEPQQALMVCVGGDQYRVAAGGGTSAKKPVPTPTKETGKEKAPIK